MIGYLVRRAGSALIVLALISLFTYMIFFLLQPDPAVTICGKTCTPDKIDSIRQLLGLDRPFWAQYGDFITGIFTGRTYGDGPTAIQCSAPCLGFSFQTQQPVLDLMLSRLPVSVTIAVGAAVLWVVFGVAGGLVSAIKQGSVWDRTAMAAALTGISVPITFAALLLQYVLVVQLQVLPFPQSVAFGDDPVAWFDSYLMPWLVLALGYAAIYARIVRANVIDTLQEDYLRTARAKGLSAALVIRRHALRPSLTPVVTLFGMDFAGLLGGAVITERLRPQRRRQARRRLHRQERPARHHGRHAPRRGLRGRRERGRRRAVHRARPPSEDHLVTATAPHHQPARAVPGTPLLEVEHLTIAFPTSRGPVEVVKDLSFRVEPDSTLGIVGESGSGKSMTSLAVMGLVPRGGRSPDPSSWRARSSSVGATRSCGPCAATAWRWCSRIRSPR